MIILESDVDLVKKKKKTAGAHTCKNQSGI
jgi:hypothetical protein